MHYSWAQEVRTQYHVSLHSHVRAPRLGPLYLTGFIFIGSRFCPCVATRTTCRENQARVQGDQDPFYFSRMGDFWLWIFSGEWRLPDEGAHGRELDKGRAQYVFITPVMVYSIRPAEPVW